MVRQILRWAVLALTVVTSGCGGLRDWLSPFRGLNSDVSYGEPGVGQYRQLGEHDPPTDSR